MPMYKHVLATIDLTEGHEEVAQKAAELAKLFGASLSMIHVVSHSFLSAAWAPSVGGFGMAGGSSETELKKKVDDARAALQQLADAHGQPDAKLHVWVASSTKAALREVLKAEDIDLMVLGSHQRGPLERMLVNSSGYQLLRNATCDVMVVDLPTT